MINYLLLIVVVCLIPVSFAAPYIGVLAWSWIGYMNPHRLTWGFAYDLPVAMMIGVATLAGLLFTKDRSPLPKFREVGFLLLLWLTMLLSTIFSFYPEEAWTWFNKVSKILFMVFITMILINDKRKLMLLTWVIAGSIGFFGFKGGIFSILTGGSFMVLGPEESFIAGNTEIGLAMNMILPILLFLRREETRPWVRHLLLATFLLTIVAILITYSRGALLGLIAVLFVLLLKSKKKMIAYVLVALMVPVTISYLPEQWFGKMDTIRTYEEDMSAQQRLRAWRLSFHIAADYPLLGVGFRAFSAENYARWDPEGPPTRGDAHSIYLQLLAEHGYTGLTLYLGLIFSTMLSLRQLIRRSRGDPSMQWIFNYAHMLEASLIAYLVCGTFLSMSYFDLFYHLIAIVILLKKFSLAEVREKTLRNRRKTEDALPEPAGAG